MFWHWPTIVPTRLYDEEQTKKLCSWPNVKCLTVAPRFDIGPPICQRVCMMKDQRRNCVVGPMFNAYSSPTCFDIGPSMYDEGPTKKLFCWANVNCLCTEAQCWPNRVITLAQHWPNMLVWCNITTMAQHKLHRWPYYILLFRFAPLL
jgi:hypothetical protein